MVVEPLLELFVVCFACCCWFIPRHLPRPPWSRRKASRWGQRCRSCPCRRRSCSPTRRRTPWGRTSLPRSRERISACRTQTAVNLIVVDSNKDMKVLIYDHGYIRRRWYHGWRQKDQTLQSLLQNSWISCYRIKTAVTVLLGPSDVIHDTYRLDSIPVIHYCDVRTDRLSVFKRYLTLLKVLNKFGYLETDSYRFHSSVRVVNLWRRTN